MMFYGCRNKCDLERSCSDIVTTKIVPIMQHFPTRISIPPTSYRVSRRVVSRGLPIEDEEIVAVKWKRQDLTN